MYKNHGLAAYKRERSNILAFLILAPNKEERSAPRSDRLLPREGVCVWSQIRPQRSGTQKAYAFGRNTRPIIKPT